MKICHVCKAECEENAELCPVCGAVLIGLSEENAAKTEISEPTLLVSIEDVVSAEIFKDILKDNEILFITDADEDDGAMQVTFGGGFVAEKIYVDEEDFERAKSLYDEFLESESEIEDDFFFDEEVENI